MNTNKSKTIKLKPNILKKQNDQTNEKIDDVAIIDSKWVNTRFMISDDELDNATDVKYRYWSTADDKFTDTSLGGNIAINSRPQFTPYADIPSPGRVASRNEVTVNGRTGNNGMGRYYSEAIDDNSELVYLSFGIPRFNSIFDFFSKSVDYVDSVIANTGRSPIGYRAGQLGGAIAMLVAFPVITLSIWFTKTVVGFLTGHGSFNYYYMEETMHTYWGSVNTIVTQMATELGLLIPELLDKDASQTNKIGSNYKFNQDAINNLKALMPGIISKENYIDVFAIATRAQTMANEQMLRDRALFESKQPQVDGIFGYLKRKFSSDGSGDPGSTTINAIDSAISFETFIKKFTTDTTLPFAKEVDGSVDMNTDTAKPDTNTKITSDDIKNARFLKDENGRYNNNADTSNLLKFAKAIDSGIKEGGAYAVFKVDYSGSVSESFSNSVGEIGTSGALKSLAKKSRDVKFNLSGGNVLGDTVSSIAGYVKDTVAGALDSVTFGASNVVQTLLGGGYIDIPKKWDDSSYTPPSVNYRMQLVSPYANQISQLQNIYIPLALLLAGAMPQATGRASYTSPYLCKLFNKGKQKIDLGMITSLTITRGTSNLAFNKFKQALAIDVSFTVTDFSNILSAPVPSSIFQTFSPELQDDTPFSKYISVICSRDLLTSKYAVPKAKINLSRKIMNIEQTFSPNSWGLLAGESLRGVLGSVANYSSIAGGTQSNH